MNIDFLKNNNFTKVNQEKIESKYSIVSFGKSTELDSFFSNYGGRNYLNGALKIHNTTSSVFWTKKLEHIFSEYNSRIISFAFDWLGRQFALYLPKKDEATKILMFDPATLNDYELEVDLVTFFETDLVEYIDETISLDDYRKWVSNEKTPDFFECIGHKISLFLGGEDSLKNYQLVDIQLNWDFQKELFDSIKGIPEGTKVNKVLIGGKNNYPPSADKPDT